MNLIKREQVILIKREQVIYVQYLLLKFYVHFRNTFQKIIFKNIIEHRISDSMSKLFKVIFWDYF